MKKLYILVILAILVAGCSKHDSSPKLPSQATLLFPDNNAACIAGTSISATQNTVPFSWQSSANTSSYKLVVKNLLTGDSTAYNSNSPGVNATLLKNTPYSWHVISRSNSISTTASSDVWKFYNSGPGIVSHAPFPAQLTSPTFGQEINATAGQVTLSWSCNDVDNDLVSYNVYFGTTATPPISQNGVTSATLAVNVTSGTIYYWMIVATDSKGNTSTSDVYQFKVN